jgi:hypothetical protein
VTWHRGHVAVYKIHVEVAVEEKRERDREKEINE